MRGTLSHIISWKNVQEQTNGAYLCVSGQEPYVRLIVFYFQKKFYLHIREHGGIIASKCASLSVLYWGMKHSLWIPGQRIYNTQHPLQEVKWHDTLVFKSTRRVGAGLCGNCKPTELSQADQAGEVSLARTEHDYRRPMPSIISSSFQVEA